MVIIFQLFLKKKIDKKNKLKNIKKSNEANDIKQIYYFLRKNLMVKNTLLTSNY